MRTAALALLVLLSLTGVSRAAQHPSQATPELLRALKNAVNSVPSFKDRYSATVWLMDMSNRLKPFISNAATRMHLLKLVHREASHAGVSPNLVLAVIQVESRFDRFAVSSAGARGLMQVMPFWLTEIGRPHDDLFHAATNLRMGCTILKYYLKRTRGDMIEALERYNGSTGGSLVYANRVLKALRARWYAR
jgi:soluble lytic murein transglycosylase-like protein